jgi:hypothetical protein
MMLLAGLEPGKDIEIRIAALRLGEYFAKNSDLRGIYSVIGMMGLGCKQIPQPPAVTAVNLCSPSPSQVEEGMETPQSSAPVRAMGRGAAR